VRDGRDNGFSVKRIVGRRRSRGQALVEFALIFPVFILLLFGILDLGRAIYAYNTVGQAAREGARVAIVNQIETSPDCSQDRPIQNPLTPHWSIKACAAKSAVSLGVQPGDVSVSYAAPPGVSLSCSPTVAVGCIVSVTVDYTYNAITPVIGNIVGAIGMSSTSSVPVERVFP
jgi:Flp pilus assembly protein TadG